MYIGIMNRVLMIKSPGFDLRGLRDKYRGLIRPKLLTKLDEIDPVWTPEGKYVSSSFLRPVWWIDMRRIGETIAQKARVSKLSMHEFVECRPKDKILRYRQAYDELKIQGNLIPRDKHVNIFIKWELCEAPDKDPRIISPRSCKYNIVLGQYINKFTELAVYDSIDALWGDKVVFKHCSLPAMATEIVRKWRMFPNPVAVGLDASRFDQHVSDQALRFEHFVYRRLFPGQKDLNELLRVQLCNYCKGKGDVYDFEYKGTGRMSGDMNTSLGNVILMTSALYHWKQILGLDFLLVNNGDDSVAIMDQSELEAFTDGFDLFFPCYGFNMVAEESVTVIEHIEFCQMNPVQLDTGWMMVRKPKSVLKDMVAISERGVAKYNNYLRDVGFCGLSLYSSCPLVGVFYDVLSSMGTARLEGELRGGLAYWMKQGEERIEVKPGSYSLESLSSYCRAFKFDPMVVTHFEELVRSDLYAAVQMLSRLC